MLPAARISRGARHGVLLALTRYLKGRNAEMVSRKELDRMVAGINARTGSRFSIERANTDRKRHWMLATAIGHSVAIGVGAEQHTRFSWSELVLVVASMEYALLIADAEKQDITR